MREITINALGDGLGGKYAGCTLWVGAGAPMAVFPKSPSWSAVVRELEVSPGIPSSPEGDFPDRLDRLCEARGLAEFRKLMRKRLIADVSWDTPNLEMLVHQARLGSRASTIVTFNIQTLSALPFTLLHGSRVLRAHHWKQQVKTPRPQVPRGVASVPIVYVHGALDLSGDCVMTRSEYQVRSQGASFQTAVASCFGADLVIVGMSLDDDYLREALLRERNSVRRIFWVRTAGDERHRAWARYAQITSVVAASYDELWRGIACAGEQLSTRSASTLWASQLKWYKGYQDWYEHTYLREEIEHLLTDRYLSEDDCLERLQDLRFDFEASGLSAPDKLLNAISSRSQRRQV